MKKSFLKILFVTTLRAMNCLAADEMPAGLKLHTMFSDNIENCFPQ
jgi:hypothetical protein